MKILNTFLIIFIFAFCTVHAQAPKENQKAFTKTTYAENTLGLEMQSLLSTFCTTCQIIKNPDKSRDYIPKEYKNFNLQLGSQLVEKLNLNMKGEVLLHYIFTSDEIKNPLTVGNYTYNVANNLELPNWENYSIVAPGASLATYKSACTNYLTVNATSNSKSLPYLSYSLTGSVDDKRITSIYLLDGSFTSPLFNIINSRNDLTAYNYLMFRLWDLYAKNKNMIGNAYYLRQFEGMFLGVTTSTEEFRNLEGSSDINASFFVSAGLKTNAGSSVKTSFLGQKYETFIYNRFSDKNSREKQFEPLPTVDTVASYFQGIIKNTHIENDGELVAYNKPFKIFVDMDGVPDIFINSEKLWKVTDIADGAFDPGSVSLVYHSIGAHKLRFEILGTPAKKIFASTSGMLPPDQIPSVITYKFNIAYAQQIGHHQIILPVSMQIGTTTKPNLTLPSNLPLTIKFGQAKGSSIFSWTGAVTVDEEGNKIK
ncbi:MAG: hypothetical protein H7235_08655, partial [Bdellovibrionaceae bacterium]|nr:hypothetical protein [Pseudobdellovibrionaceae bacterium]